MNDSTSNSPPISKLSTPAMCHWVDIHVMSFCVVLKMTRAVNVDLSFFLSLVCLLKQRGWDIFLTIVYFPIILK